MKNNNLIIRIPGKSLYINRIYYVNNSNLEPYELETLLAGQVTYPDGQVSIGAGVEIIENGDFRRSIACTFTDENGEYEIYFKYKPYMNYELNIYDIALDSNYKLK